MEDLEKTNYGFKSGCKFYIKNNLYVLIDWVYTKNDMIAECKKFKRDSLFYIGEETIKVEAEEFLFTENNRIFLCHEFHINPYYSRAPDKQYYLCILKMNDDYYNKLIKIDLKTNLLKSLVNQFEEKCFKLTLSSVQKHDRFNFYLNFEVYLTERLNKEAMASKPAEYYTNLHRRSEINTLISHFCFKEDSPLRELSNKFDDISDCQVFCEKMNENKSFKNAHDTLFELIQQQNNIHNVISEKEIDLIQKNANLIPLLRPYQINAVKWMLGKEKYDFGLLDSEWPSNVCFFYKNFKFKIFRLYLFFI